MMAGCFDPKLFGNALNLDAAHGGAALTSGTAADIAQCSTADPGNAANDLVIPTADFDPVANAIQSNYYLAGQDGNDTLSNNYKYLAPGNGDLAKQIGRLDYNITLEEPHRLFDHRALHADRGVYRQSELPGQLQQCFERRRERADLGCVDHQSFLGQRSAFFV